MISTTTIRAAAALLLATTAVGSAQAYTIAAPGSVVAGKTIADWGVEWWKWVFNAPVAANPLFDPTGSLTQRDNQRAVFFIGGGADGYGPATNITVAVPLGKPVLVRLVNLIDFEAPDFYQSATTPAALQALATATADGYEAGVSPSALAATIDGNVVADPYQYLAREPGLVSFGPVRPGSVGEAFAGGATLDTGAATGWYLLLNDLSLGRHTLTLSGSTASFSVDTPDGPYRYDGFSVDQTVTLNVGGVPEPTSWALLVGGFGFVGAGLRARRMTVVAA
jgi:hypothetical protein